MRNIIILPLASILFFSCKSSTKQEKEGYFPVIPFIKSQVAHVDTSLYSIMKLNFIDSNTVDTQYFPREQFRTLAQDFLSLPDITDKKNKDVYKEEKMFDEGMNTVILTYLPEEPEKVPILRQEVLITPHPAGDKVKSIFIDYSIGNRDSSVQKKLLWQTDRSFQVTTIRQKPGQPETINTSKVIWNETEQP